MIIMEQNELAKWSPIFVWSQETCFLLNEGETVHLIWLPEI